MRENEQSGVATSPPPMPVALAYATPIDDGPRPGVAVWIAAGLVWAALLLVGLVFGFAFLFILNGGDVGGILFGIGFFALLIGTGVAEFFAVARRSLVGTGIVCTLAGAAAILMGFSILIQLVKGGFDLSSDGAAMLLMSGMSFLLWVVIPAFVAVAHARWGLRLRQWRNEMRLR